MRKFLTVLILSVVCSAPTLAEHQTGKVDALAARLGSLNPDERKLLIPYLAQGPVVLTEFQNRQTDLPAVIYAARIHAPAKTVARVIGNPAGYPRFMSALTSVDIQAVHGQMTAFEWTWGVTLFSLTGHNV
ncbi:MAG: hypothetical protein JRF54_11055, partial [Deltaproteobacteria bacterium]|nr:hypothetical protein [Deltaproteobacteria bacterium]